MRSVLLMMLICAVHPARAQITAASIIDLTHPFDERTIFWPTEKGFMFEKGFEGVTGGGYFYTANRFCTAEHGGTHIDAPIHFHRDRNTVDAIPLGQLIGSGVVVDVSEECAANRDYRVMTRDILKWEGNNGPIEEGTIVLLRTGFGRYWPDRRQYMGTDERGDSAVRKLRFPGLHPDAAEWLVTRRKIKAIGIDTPSIDHGQSTLFESHVTLFEHNVPVFENVANVDRLPDKGFTIIALPMKIRGGSGGPLRIVALIHPAGGPDK